MGFLDIFKATKNKQLLEANQKLAATCDSLSRRVAELENQVVQQMQDYTRLEASVPREKKDLDAAIEQTKQLQEQIAESEAMQEALNSEISELESEEE